MVQVPVTPNDAPDNAQSRADLDRALAFADMFIRANADTMERQAGMIERQAHAISELYQERGRLKAERDAAVARAEKAEGLAELLDTANDTERARAEKAEEELSHLRIDVRRAERQAEQAQHVADAQEQRANDLCRQLEQARQAAARSWWRRIF